MFSIALKRCLCVFVFTFFCAAVSVLCFKKKNVVCSFSTLYVPVYFSYSSLYLPETKEKVFRPSVCFVVLKKKKSSTTCMYVYVVSPLMRINVDAITAKNVLRKSKW